MSRKKQVEWVLEIGGMTCEHCPSSIDEALRKVHGVVSSTTSFADKRARVVAAQRVAEPDLKAAVEDPGYRVRTIRAVGGRDRRPATDGSEADVIVVGGGSAGFAAAIRAHELGAKVRLVNAGILGGTCVNVGCVPSKTLIRAAEVRHRAMRHAFEGVRTAADGVDFAAVIRQKDELVESLRKAKYADVLAAYERVELVEGRARLAGTNTVQVGDRELRASKIIITTGSRPWIPPIPGLRESRPLTSTTAFELKRLPESLIVMGGRYVALEIAQMMSRFGSRVTILQRSGHLLPTEDEELTEMLAGFLREEGIRVETGVRIERVERDGGPVTVRAQIGGQAATFQAEEILCATGRRAITEGLGLEDRGVERDGQGHIVVNDYLETSVPGIYAAGDVIGEPAFVYTAAYEGKLAAENALNGNRTRRDYTALPWVIFTDPQVAGVGMNEKEAAAAGIAVETARLDLSDVPRALAARDTRGFIKLLRGRGTDRLAGARVLAPEGGEQIMEAALAIRHGIGVSELASAFHPYLTQAEGIKLCAQTFGKDVKKLSCCAA